MRDAVRNKESGKGAVRLPKILVLGAAKMSLSAQRTHVLHPRAALVVPPKDSESLRHRLCCY